MLEIVVRFRSLILAVVVILSALLIVVNVVKTEEETPGVKVLPPEPIALPDPTKKMDEDWKAKLAEHDKWLADAHQEHLWRQDIKRESHSMRAQAYIFMKMNHEIERERREAERLERIRIQKEKAAERKRLREEKAEERRRQKQEKKQSW